MYENVIVTHAAIIARPSNELWVIAPKVTWGLLPIVCYSKSQLFGIRIILICVLQVP